MPKPSIYFNCYWYLMHLSFSLKLLDWSTVGSELITYLSTREYITLHSYKRTEVCAYVMLSFICDFAVSLTSFNYLFGSFDGNTSTPVSIRAYITISIHTYIHIYTHTIHIHKYICKYIAHTILKQIANVCTRLLAPTLGWLMYICIVCVH